MADDRFTIDLEKRVIGGLRAIPDFNGTTGTDIGAVIAAAAATFSGSTSPNGGTIKIGEGEFYAPNGIFLDKCINLEGAGGDPFGRGGTIIWVPADKTGLTCEGYFSYGSTGRRSENSTVKGIHFASLHNSNLKSAGANRGALNPRWRPGTAYSAGNIVNPSHFPKQTPASFPSGIHHDWTYAYKCITGGTSHASTEPTWHNYESAAIGNITGASAANPCVVTCNDAQFANGHGMASGESITIAGVTGTMSAINGTHTVTVTGLTTFTIAVNTTGLVYGGGGTTRRADITDNGVVWRQIQAHGADVRDSRIEIERCVFSGFPGAAIRTKTGVRGEYNASSNFLRVRQTTLYQCSTGISMYGGDSNGCGFTGIDTHFMLCYGFNDHGVAANSYIQCSTDVCENGAFAGSNLDIYGTYVEATPGVNVLYGHSRFMGGAIGRAGLPCSPYTPVNFTLEGGSMCFSDPSTDKRPLTWAEAAGFGTLITGQIVKPSTPNGYVYYVAEAGTLGAEPSWKLGYDWNAGASNAKLTTSGTVKFAAACVDTLSTFVRDQDQDFVSGRRILNLFGDDKYYFNCGFADNSYPTQVIGWGSLDSTVDSASPWTLGRPGTSNWWSFNRAGLGTGDAIRMHFGDKPVVGLPNGLELTDVVTAPVAPSSGFREYSESGILKRIDAAGKVRGVTRVTQEINNTTYTVLATDTRVNVRALSGGAKTITLPTLASVWDDYEVTIGDADGSIAGANTIVVDGNGAETISGAATKTIGSAWGQVVLRAYPTRSTWVLVGSVGTIT